MLWLLSAPLALSSKFYVLHASLAKLDPHPWQHRHRRLRECGSLPAGRMITAGHVCSSEACRPRVRASSITLAPPYYVLMTRSLCGCPLLTVKSWINEMLNKQPRMRINALFNYLVEMHSVSPSLKSQIQNYVHNNRNRYMSLALGCAAP